MLSAGLHIYLRPRVTLNFDLLTPKLIILCPCPVDHVCHLASKLVHSFKKCCAYKIGNGRRV